jgi:hypothetical protein
VVGSPPERPTDGGYRERVDAHFKRLYKTLDLGIPIVEIQGPRSARIMTIANHIGSPALVLPPAEPLGSQQPGNLDR